MYRKPIQNSPVCRLGWVGGGGGIFSETGRPQMGGGGGSNDAAIGMESQLRGNFWRSRSAPHCFQAGGGGLGGVGEGEEANPRMEAESHGQACDARQTQ